MRGAQNIYNPSLLSANGNSLSMISTVSGIDYKISYLHLNEVPTIPGNGEIKRGQQIGLLGTTGSSTGNHLHVEVTTVSRPDIPALYYDPIMNSRGEISGYRINSDYFMREMLKSEIPR
ncbi:M23 family metallopeptidase [Leptospira jelokensis]|uniref:M23 family metallopeptidase n=1 Tax=Leptospira jelokensis TaxID=2484931 RepID=A0A4Z0ZXP0_9LEPT|nr:M23 family metallopeptidase [Leptospira jelokensis]TGL57780.1 M23 family metallopeptidase [Leptospira jelokensis]